MNFKTKDFTYEFNKLKGRCMPARANYNRKVHDLDVDASYLKRIWKKQDGICPITGLKLILRTYKNNKEKLLPNHASVDRIDNSKGYIKGNIRFTSVMVNYALNTKFTDNDLVELACHICKTQMKDLNE